MNEAPKCPECGALMVLRTARKGRNRGNQFYGCSNYPRCKTTIGLSEVNSEVGNSKRKGASSPCITSAFDYNQGGKYH